jgi:hypothetical protein
MGVHDAEAVEFEEMFLLVMGKNAKKGLEVFWRSEQWLFGVTTEDDMVDGGRRGYA